MSRFRRDRRWLMVGPVLALLLLAGGTDTAYAKLVGGVQAGKVGAEAVELKLTVDADALVKIVIGTNQITFRVKAGVELVTGKLRISGDMVQVFENDKLVCRIPVRDITEEFKRFCYDDRRPVVRVTPSPSPNANGWNNTNVTVTVTAEDEPDGSGIKAIYYKIGAQSPVEVGIASLTLSEGGRMATYRLTVSDEDTHYLGFWARDKAENESDQQVLTVRIDKTRPSVSVSVSPTSIRQGESIRVTVTATDGLSGIDSVSASDSNLGTISLSRSGDRWDATIQPSRSGQVTAMARDKAGNSSSAGPAPYTVTTPQPPRADFSCSPTSGTPPLTVECSDRSSGDITSWHWDFGDGSTSSSRNPSHTYHSSGRYKITLTVHGPGGSDTKEFCCVEVLRTGDVKVTLIWWSTADLDLHVVDPNGCEIYWDNRRCPSGGELDVDANCDCGSCGTVTTTPVENIYWPPGQAPRGEYKVYVKYYRLCHGASSTESFKVRILVDGKELEYTGKVSEDKKVLVTTFQR